MAKPKKSTPQLALQFGGGVRQQQNEIVNEIRFLTLLLEVSGEANKAKQAKVDTARDTWLPAVNNWDGLGRWAFLEVTYMENAADLIRATFLPRESAPVGGR